MWWRCAKPPIFAGSFSIIVRKTALVQAIKLLGVDFHRCGSFVMWHYASKDSTLKM